MDITDTELKEKLVNADNLMVATEKELLAVIKVPYTENTGAKLFVSLETFTKLQKNTHF